MILNLGGIIQEKAEAGNILSAHFFNYSLFDLSNRTHLAVPNGDIRLDHGFGADICEEGSGYIELADHNDFSFGDGGSDVPFSIAMLVWFDDVSGCQYLSKGVYNTDCEYRIASDASGQLYMSLYDESVASCFIGRTYLTSLDNYRDAWHLLVFTYDGSSDSDGVKIYLDAVQVDDAYSRLNYGSYVAMENLNHNVEIGRHSTSYSSFKMKALLFFNEELSQPDITELNQQLLYELPGFSVMQQSKSMALFSAKVKPNLTFGVNMIPSDNQILDISGNGNHLAIVGAVPECHPIIGRTMRFDGSDDELSCADNAALQFGTDDFTICMLVKFDDYTDNRAQYLVRKQQAANNRYYLAYLGDSNDKVQAQIGDGVATADIDSANNAIAANVWQYIVLVIDRTNDEGKIYINGVQSGVTADISGVTGNVSPTGTFYIGSDGTNRFDGLIESVEVYKGEAKSEAWIIDKYTELKKSYSFKIEDGLIDSIAAEGGTAKGILSNSSFRFGEATVRAKIVSNLVRGQLKKEIECTTAGVLYLDTALLQEDQYEAAYGTWEFEIVPTANDIGILFVADQIGHRTSPATLVGYTILLSSGTRIYLQRVKNDGTSQDLFYSAAGYLSVGIRYRFKITRSALGVFNVYVNDVLVPAAWGSNPVTDNTEKISKFINLELNNGDVIGNITKKIA